MKRFIPISCAIVAIAHFGPAFGAEDHSAHQHQPSQEPTESELRHVPPAPPRFAVTHTSNEAMIELMEMDDTARFGKALLDQVEWGDEDTLGWDAQAWYGGDYNKLWLKTEGEHFDGAATGNVELLWDRVVARWWDVQAGVRHDFGAGPSRTWAAFGVQGLAPYWFEVEATVYVGDAGRSAARLVGEYELLLTQRWILQPKLELNLYGKQDAQNQVGSGLSDVEAGLRLRYEIRREFAPFVGVVWSRRFGGSADFLRDAGEDVSDVQFVAGLRIWF
jgi:copper resistance protein B